MGPRAPFRVAPAPHSAWPPHPAHFRAPPIHVPPLRGGRRCPSALRTGAARGPGTHVAPARKAEDGASLRVLARPPVRLPPWRIHGGGGGAASAFACRPCTRTRGALRVWARAPSLAPLAHTRGKGAPLPCLRLPFASPLHPNPGGALQVWARPRFACSLGAQGGTRPFPSTRPPVRVLPLRTNGDGAQGGGSFACRPCAQAREEGGAPLLGVAPATHRARVAFGGRGVRKGEGSPFSFLRGDTKRGGVPPPALATPPLRFPHHPRSVHVANEAWGVRGQAGGGGRT